MNNSIESAPEDSPAPASHIPATADPPPFPMLPFAKVLKISRPRFWMYIFGPYIVGLISGAKNLNDLATWRIIIFGLYFLLPANFLIYGINDIFDWESDRENAKKAGYEALIKPDERSQTWISIAFFNVPFLLLIPFLGQQELGGLCFFLFFGIFYSMPPLRAKTKPFADSIFNVLYVFPGIFSFYLVGGENYEPPLFAAAWCWAMAMHAYSAVPDIEVDRTNKMQTIATTLGFRYTLIACAALYALAAFLAWGMLHTLALLLGVLYVGLMLDSLRAGESGIFKRYQRFPRINTAVGFVIFWCIVIFRFYR